MGNKLDNINETGHITFKAKFVTKIYPRDKNITDYEPFGIIKWQLLENIEGIVSSQFPLVTGKFYFEPNERIEYILQVKEVFHPKYGQQYEIISWRENIDFSKVSGQKTFLSTFLTENQIDNLYNLYDNPLKIISKHDVDSLIKVKGIKKVLAQKIIERFENSKTNAELYIKLGDLGLTTNFIDSLISRYKVAPVIIDKVRNHPYDLAKEMDGVGFTRADELAMKVGISAQSPERIKAYIEFILDKKAQEGNSYVYAKELMTWIYEQFQGKENILKVYTDSKGNLTGNNISMAIDQLVEKDIIRIQENEKRSERKIYLTKYYWMELETAYHLNRLLKSENKFEWSDWEQKIKEQETKQGWNFTQEQIEGIKLGLEKQVCFVTGGAGCVDADTEFFTGKGWKRIADYQEGDKVLQYNEDGTASLVIPQRYIKEPCKELWHFETNYGVNQTVCDEHKIIYWSQKGKKHECNINDIIEKQSNPNSGWRGQFETIFKYNGKGISYSDAEIRLMCAIIADGSFYSNSKEGADSFLTCRFHIKKERKKQRLKMLFTLNNLEYKEKQSRAEGYTDFYITAPVREKEFFSYWYDCNPHQLEVVCDEVLNWDGCVNTSHTGTIRRSFSSCSEATIDFIQFAFHNCGYKATKRQYDRRNRERKNTKYNYKSIEYVLTISSRHRIGLNYDNRSNRKTPKTMPQKVSTIDGYKYCFTVDSHMLILRRQGNIFITGNCGKSSLVSGILSVLSKYSFAQCSLSGKAAARLKEVTGQDGYTIHRLLGYQPGRGFAYNELNPLNYDIIIVDEISLIGGEIFLDLLRAIPNGTKVFILGDMGQLESIGCMNLASDLFKSEKIPTKELKTIHRQAKKSGIILSSYAIRNGEQVFSNTFEGEDIIGELQDMTFDICSKEEVVNHIIERFEYYYEQPEFDIMNVQLISPVKDRGNSSVYVLNTEIQKIVNPVLENEHNTVTIPISTEKLYKIHKNDKVLCIKNCYDIETTEENVKTDIYNGWIGIIENIEDYSQTITVYFPLIDKKVVIPYEKKNILTLGYAITCHKMQGASAKVIIGAVDFSTPPMMLTKELLYTMITRAEKECIVVGQNRAIRKAIDQSGISDKKTFLLDMLDKDIATEADYEALNKAINKRKEKYLPEKTEDVRF